jgi:hypothetical protein
MIKGKRAPTLILMGMALTLMLQLVNTWPSRTNAPDTLRYPPKPQQSTHVPEPSITPTFRHALTEYERLHSSMVSGTHPNPRFIRLTCGSLCGGWGDRLKGIFVAIAIGWMTNRAFIIELNQAGTPLELMYRPSPIAWNASNTVGTFKHSKLVDHVCHQVIPAILANRGDSHTIEVNRDCASAILTHPEFHAMYARFDLENNPYWRTHVFERYFRPTPVLMNAIRTVLDVPVDAEPAFPHTAIHMRTAMIPGDERRYFGPLEDMIGSFASCLGNISTQYSDTDDVFVAADLDPLVGGMESRLTEAGRRVYTGAAVGEIGHVERYTAVSNLALRLHTEFELIRNSKYFIVGRSGFSLMAWKVRHRVEDAVIRFGETVPCPTLFAPGGDEFYYVTYD